VFTRGSSPDALPASVERLRGDRNEGPAGLATLAGRSWDACVDVSGYTPRQVRASAELLAGATGQYVFVSTVSVYDAATSGPVLESAPLLPAASEDVTDVTGATYGPLKVTCERIVGDVFGTRSVALRPQIVAGPFDPTGRYTYWVQRTMQPGELLAPGDGTDSVQVVDARDIGHFTSRVIERRLSGAFNLAGPRFTWRTFLAMLGATSPVWVEAAAIDAFGLTFADLPLFVPAGAPHASIMDVSASLAVEQGFTMTEAHVTVADTRAWLRFSPVSPVLTPARERDAMAFARSRGWAV